MKDDRHPPEGAIRSFCAAPQDNPMAGKPTTAQRSQGSFSSRSDADLLLRPPSGYRRRFFFFFCPVFLPKWKRKTWWETVGRGRRQTHSRGMHRLSVFDLVAVFSKSNYSTTDGHANSKDPAAIRSTLFSNLARKLNQLILLNNLLDL